MDLRARYLLRSNVQMRQDLCRVGASEISDITTMIPSAASPTTYVPQPFIHTLALPNDNVVHMRLKNAKDLDLDVNSQIGLPEKA